MKDINRIDLKIGDIIVISMGCVLVKTIVIKFTKNGRPIVSRRVQTYKKIHLLDGWIDDDINTHNSYYLKNILNCLIVGYKNNFNPNNYKPYSYFKAQLNGN